VIYPVAVQLQMLAQSIVEDNLAQYNRGMRVKFGWLSGARKIIDNLSRVPLLSLPVAYQALRYQGIKPTIMDLMHVRKRLIEANK